MLKHYLKNPKNTGMVIPSSKKLAKALTIEASNFEHVIEVGAGSGAITKKLLEIVEKDRIDVVEYNTELAKTLRLNFFQESPQKVWHGPLHEFEDKLNALPDSCIMISSLPFKSLSPEIKEKTIQLFLAFVRKSPHRCIYQYSYVIPLKLDKPFHAPPDVSWQYVKTVYGNVPPAKVWKLVA